MHLCSTLVQHIPTRKCRYLQTAGGSAFSSPPKAFRNARCKHAHTFCLWRFHALKVVSVWNPSLNKIMLFTIRSTERLRNLPVIFLFAVAYASLTLEYLYESKCRHQRRSMFFTLRLHFGSTPWRNCLKASVTVRLRLLYSCCNCSIADMLRNERSGL